MCALRPSAFRTNLASVRGVMLGSSRHHPQKNMLQGIFLSAPLLFLLFWARMAHIADSAKPPEPAYIGSRACGQCHTGQHRQWSQSLHSRMIQQAKPEVILGDFVKNNTLEHHGW